jgi:peptidoglycan/LPS O-acetylase OafA/YrhL
VFLLLKNWRWRFGVTLATTALLTAQGSFTAHSYCAILHGAMLAQLMERPQTYRIVAALTRVPAAVPLAFVAALFAMLRYIEVLPAVALVATYLIAYVIMQDGAMRRLLTFAPLVYLGQRSYGAYLLHVLAIHIGYIFFGSTTNIGGLLTACFTLMVTIPAAELLYRVVERPGTDMTRRLAGRVKAAKRESAEA